MLHNFIANNRDALLEECAARVALRPARGATPEQLKNGLPIFLNQLRRTLIAEELGQVDESIRISGPDGGGDAATVSEIGISAVAHGKELMRLGYTVDQVVHDYGDLCQAVTALAVSRQAPFGVDEFRTLNRCLDNAIAKAVTEFSMQRDSLLAARRTGELKEMLGALVHEMRNALGTAMLAVTAMQTGALPIGGATGSVLKRSHATMKTLVDGAMDDFRGLVGPGPGAEVFDVATLVADATGAMALHLQAGDKTIEAPAIDAGLQVRASRERVLGALTNLLHNALKFTKPATAIAVTVTSDESSVRIDVADHCGGLPPDSSLTMFSPFSQRSTDRSGLGIGLSISRNNVEADGGTLTVMDVPEIGCVFTIRLPVHRA